MTMEYIGQFDDWILEWLMSNLVLSFKVSLLRLQLIHLLSFSLFCLKNLSGYRGNAVMRSAAKKQLMQDSDASVYVPIDASTKITSRPNKSKADMAIRRIFRTLRVITVVAAVNLPIYMILLFKDWIDKWCQRKWLDYLYGEGASCGIPFFYTKCELYKLQPPPVNKIPVQFNSSLLQPSPGYSGKSSYCSADYFVDSGRSLLCRTWCNPKNSSW